MICILGAASGANIGIKRNKDSMAYFFVANDYIVQRHHPDCIFPSTSEAEEVKAPYKEPDEAWL